MNTSKIENIESQKANQINDNFPDFNGRLDLVLKIISIILNLSISESNQIDISQKKEMIKKYDDMFKNAKDEYCLNLQRIMTQNFLKDIMKNFTFFNAELLPFINNALLFYNKFLKNQINVDKLMDELITLFSKSIFYVKKNNGKSYSFDLTNEFYSYLDDISKRTKNLKELVSKKKYNEEEIKNKEKAESNSEYYFKIEQLKKLIEEKNSELNLVNEKLLSMTLNLGTYQDINESLKKKLMITKICQIKLFKRIKRKISKLKNIRT